MTVLGPAEFKHHIKKQAGSRFILMAGLIGCCVFLSFSIGVCMKYYHLGPFQRKRVSYDPAIAPVVYRANSNSNQQVTDGFLTPEPDHDVTTIRHINGK